MIVLPPRDVAGKPVKRARGAVWLDSVECTRLGSRETSQNILASTMPERKRWMPLVLRDRLLVMGRDQYAYAKATGRVTMQYTLVDAEDFEVEALFQLDDLAPSKTVQERYEMMLKVYEALVPQYRRNTKSCGAPIPLHREVGTPAERAVRTLAIATGLSPKSVSNYLIVARGRREGKEYYGHKNLRGPGLKTWGYELDPEWTTKVREYNMRLQIVAGLLGQARHQLTKAMVSDIPQTRGDTHSLCASIEALKRRVSGYRAYALCPWCKGQEELQRSCEGCQRRGYVYLSMKKKIPRRMKRHDLAWDSVYGVEVKVE